MFRDLVYLVMPLEHGLVSLAVQVLSGAAARLVQVLIRLVVLVSNASCLSTLRA